MNLNLKLNSKHLPQISFKLKYGEGLATNHDFLKQSRLKKEAFEAFFYNTEAKINKKTPLKIIILGDQGQLGAAFKEVLSIYQTQKTIQNNYPTFEILGLNRQDVDFNDHKTLLTHVQNILQINDAKGLNNMPFIIINAAAYTAVDKAETEQQAALNINQELPKQLAIFCKKHHGLLLHYSTDYVFDGEKNAFLQNDFYDNEQLSDLQIQRKIKLYEEEDAPAPINFYGHSKYLGEQAIIQNGLEYFIFRTSWVFDAVHANFLTTMLKLAERQKAAQKKGETFNLRIIANQYGTPNFTYSIVDASLVVLFDYLIKKMTADFKFKFADDFFGIYHLSSDGLTSWFDYAASIFKSYDKAIEAQKITALEYPTPAKRPYFSGLSSKKLARTFNYEFMNWQRIF